MHTRTYILTLLALMLASMYMSLLSGKTASAQVATSTSYSTQSSINTLGGTGSSGSFTEQQSADQTAGGQSSSLNFTLQSGLLYSASFTPQQQNWRWYDDEQNETPSSPMASENTAPATIPVGDIVKLRVTIAETGGVDGTNFKMKLQFSTASDFSSDVHDVAEVSTCTGSSVWCYATSAGGTDNALITTATLSDAGSCISGVGSGCGTHNTSGTTTSTYTQTKSSATEYEFTVQESGSAANTTYFFRMVNTASGADIPLATSHSHPSISTSVGTLSLTIGGLPSATTTSGVSTTLNTTSTSVPFGTLSVGASAIGAQRLTIDTNAASGYELYSFAQQDFLGSSDKIPGVAGTNQSPVGWSSGCTTSLSGCYGYHTSASVLSGGSTRFAANDTYAQFSTTTMSEVDYSSSPVSSKTTDIVYKVEVHDTQTADSYSTNVVYVVVPVF